MTSHNHTSPRVSTSKPLPQQKPPAAIRGFLSIRTLTSNRGPMIAPEILANNTHEEILEALRVDMHELVDRGRTAVQVGDANQYDILHGLINENLDMIDIIAEDTDLTGIR
ncbi:hypothetical protein PBI_CLUBL_151 [Gordonia phage ClubL]|uniref:Uncharacterized protein n=1 Tax=Gordonia phage ClubL TaxID=1838065 RepID=A0A160DFE3_9CAUD|nr:hypothetical protein BH768_gp056 [Gordonia phage ClubL]ANA86648.1 hypothetical protein PBI_CLUBL_151 [Gordonia phage ClubL]